MTQFGVVSLLLVLFLCCFVFGGNQDLSISIERKIDLRTQFVSEFHAIEVTNNGKSRLTNIDLALESDKLIYISVDKTVKTSEQSTLEPLTITNRKTEVHNGVEYLILTVNLPSELEPGESDVIQLLGVYSHRLLPLPKEISQREKQLMVYEANHYIASPYLLTRQVTEVNCVKIIEHSTLDPTSIDGAEETVTFGPYEFVEPFSFSKSRVHHLNPSPFITVTNMIRHIEVSHWGNIAVEETYSLQNDGAKLKGTFSRVDWMHGATGNAVPALVQHLPLGAADVYYRDIIGNISTSHVYPHQNFVKFEIAPRFMLFGGWKTQFYTGYNLPTFRYLFIDSDSQYVLKMPFVNVIEGSVIDNLEFRVILPEGVSDVEITSPYEISEIESSKRYTYLDTVGRPEFRFTISNVFSGLSDDLIIRYRFQKSFLLQEPILLIIGFFSLFLVLIFYFRLNLTISQ